MVKKYFFYLIVLNCSFAFAGGMTSSGGDFLTTENNPWFIGDEPISFCIEQGDFTREISSSEALIEEAINDWINNLKKLNIRPTPFSLPDGKKKSLGFNFIKTGCSAKTDLRFLLGVSNSDVTNELKHLATYVVAFASKGITNDKTGRAQGFIWLAPDMGKHIYKGPAQNSFWLQDANFFNVILHELGHVFGLEHQPSGFMSSYGPSNAVLGIDKQKSSVASLTAQNWLQTLQMNCGSIWGQDNEKVARLFKFKSMDDVRICIEPNDLIFDSKIHFTVSISNKQGEKATGYFEGMADINILGKTTVAGKYFENFVGTPLDYKWHTFFNLSKYKFIGKLQLSKKTYSIVVEQKMGYYLDYTILADDDVFSFKSNLGPSL